MEEKSAIEGLKTVKGIFQKNNTKFSLYQGTLLGAVRNGRLIPWDRDIDLCMFRADLSELLLKDLKKLDCFYDGESLTIFFKSCPIGIELLEERGNEAFVQYYEMKNSMGNIIDYLLNIFSLYSPEHKHGRTPKRLTAFFVSIAKRVPFRESFLMVLKFLRKNVGYYFIELTYPKEYFKDLQGLSFYDTEVWIPKKAVEYLEGRYGKNWKIPEDRGAGFKYSFTSKYIRRKEC